MEDPSETLRAQLPPFRDSGIRIDKRGNFWHNGQPVAHHGLRQALFKWLDRLPPPDGRHILRLDEARYAFIAVEDTPLVANTLRLQVDVDACEAWLSLSDGNEEPLHADGLCVDAEGTLRASVRAGTLQARLSTAAASALAPYLEEAEGRWTLILPGHTPTPLRT
jgi:hypothetical protein